MMLSSTFRPIVHRARARRDAAYGRLGGIGCRSRCPIISSATEGGHHPLHSLYPITTRCVRARKDKASLTVPDVLDDGERRPRRCKLSSATTGNAVCGDWGDVRDRRGRPYTAATHHYSLEVPILSAPAHTGTQYILVSTTCSADAKPLEFRSRRYPPCPCPRSRKPHMSSAADDWFVAGFDEAASKWLGGSASQTSWRMDFLARAWCGRWRASQSRVGGGYGCRVGGALACASSVRVSLEPRPVRDVDRASSSPCRVSKRASARQHASTGTSSRHPLGVSLASLWCISLSRRWIVGVASSARSIRHLRHGAFCPLADDASPPRISRTCPHERARLRSGVARDPVHRRVVVALRTRLAVAFGLVPLLVFLVNGDRAQDTTMWRA
ncbi:hypothetical protein BD626DRAFT_171656 [Schizophyllum amplum]|uniref:Uncharacterized protein n=1 Tax=Schizophyllum amplum TaxID=97359 RepID=A0A550CR43_9AGAR|nr:hypothetical protein BD626DRAFT_171656 [Auriculariopsis ampla]